MIRILIWAISILAIVLAAAIFLAGPGSRMGLWNFGVGLQIITLAALPVLGAALAALVALGLAVWKRRSLIPLAAVGLVAAGAAASIPLQMRAAVESNPFIHDITTDFENPPAIVAGAEADRSNPPEYAGSEPVPGNQTGATTADAQRAAFPDIVPVVVAGSVENTSEAVERILGKMGMEILANEETQTPGVRQIEAVATSFAFGFKDDFVVRLTPAGEEGTRVDVRSKSRVGVSDLGANAKRIRTFFKNLQDVT